MLNSLSYLKLLFALPVFLCTALVSAQNDTSIFRTIKQVEANEYVFSIPERWKRVPQIDASSKDEKFEFTDVGLPHVVNDAPLTAFLVLTKMSCEGIDTAVNAVIKEFTSYPDRISPAGETYTVDTLVIQSGEKALMISTRFYRRGKVSNFSLFYLVAYSEKNKASYILTITYRYKDSTYMVEADNKFKRYATRVFKSLTLR